MRPPLDYIREGRIYSGFESDEDLRHVIDTLGAECLMYASDYPHGDMSWTRVPETKALTTLSEAEKAALLGTNAARFYKLTNLAPQLGKRALAEAVR
jgi:predicted TIM-barrel fold metal-dependent hydrolase